MSNQLTGAQAMVRMLEAHEVTHIFGLCGDTSLPFYDALATLDHGIEHVHMRDERHAAYAADAYARLTNRVGVCEGPSGGGATHILPGVVEASESSAPLLAITTDIATTSRDRYALTALDQQALFTPLAKRSRVIDSGAALPHQVRAAFRAATCGRPGAAHLAFPFNVQKDQVDEDDIWADPRFVECPAVRPAPNPADIEALVECLAQSERPLFIIGGGAHRSDCYFALNALIELYDIPLCTTISGQGAEAEYAACHAGVVGSNGGTPETQQLVADSDLIVFLGCRAGSVTTERWRYPNADQKIVHIDIDPEVLGTNYRTEVAIWADIDLALNALTEALHEMDFAKTFDAQERIVPVRKAKEKVLNTAAKSTDTPIRPERVVLDLRNSIPKQAIVVVDPGTPCPYFAAYFPNFEAGQYLLTNRAHGALGYSLGAAVGAYHAIAAGRVVAVMGDGSFGFAAGELETLVRLELPITVVVLSNDSFGWIKAGQRHGFDARFYGVDFSRSNHADIAKAYGMPAWTVTEPAELKPTLKQAMTTTGPALVDVIVQPLDEAAAPVSEWVA